MLSVLMTEIKTIDGGQKEALLKGANINKNDFFGLYNQQKMLKLWRQKYFKRKQ